MGVLAEGGVTQGLSGPCEELGSPLPASSGGLGPGGSMLWFSSDGDAHHCVSNGLGVGGRTSGRPTGAAFAQLGPDVAWIGGEGAAL